jgi:hypothetical protein
VLRNPFKCNAPWSKTGTCVKCADTSHGPGLPVELPERRRLRVHVQRHEAVLLPAWTGRSPLPAVQRPADVRAGSGAAQ